MCRIHHTELEGSATRVGNTSFYDISCKGRAILGATNYLGQSFEEKE